MDKLIQGLTDALNNVADAIRDGKTESEKQETAKSSTPARGNRSSTGASPKKGAAKGEAAPKKAAKPAKTTESGAGRQEISDLVTTLAAMDRKECGEVIKKFGKATRVREVDPKHFDALADGLKAAIKKLKAKGSDDADDADLDFDDDTADDGMDLDDDTADDGNDADLDFDESDFD